ncbi:hypothetical protein [Bradyrhizobium guangdongense]|uniref:Uncharacterized protein n=1 Tax=Bradyrhizobium guangdongense TaxID=1325090 RepID=A0A410V6X1_9BRAD|nr:hypothetical protein [Bradyrhizobium guangdongense]QAU39453.1 hypothetical protein X265_18625 [Bradyrhizobium guangdongense]QOZ60513.1 hypothetical protein XH86_18635 [Bradyrhizobium guangdongense]GGI23813.1 hypothetical protein GCM10010987_26260 [Bradyrhizobium guangdongense]
MTRAAEADDRFTGAVLDRLLPIRKTVQGFEGTQLLTGFTGAPVNYVCGGDVEATIQHHHAGPSGGTLVYVGSAGTGEFYSCSFSVSAGAINNVTFTANTGCTTGVTGPASASYSKDFVDAVLAADAEKPEAEFDNVVDLLAWLDRD